MIGNTPSTDARGVEKNVIDLPPPDLYQYKAIITGGAIGLNAVSDADIQHFRDHGFLVVEDAFTAAEIKAAIDGMVDLITGKQPDFTGIMYEAAVRDQIDNIAPEDRQDYVRKISWFVEFDERLKALCEHPALLAVLKRMLNAEPDLFQDMGLIKPPKIGREKPWHQDFAYFNLPQGTPVVGVWIALDEALIENGCMHVIPGTHREGPIVHFQRRDWQICDTDVQVNRCVAVPLRPGSCLFFDGLLHHGTPPSQSDKRRRAVQYHYKPADVDLFEDSTNRLTIFGEEGKDVEC